MSPSFGKAQGKDAQVGISHESPDGGEVFGPVCANTVAVRMTCRIDGGPQGIEEATVLLSDPILRNEASFRLSEQLEGLSDEMDVSVAGGVHGEPVGYLPIVAGCRWGRFIVQHVEPLLLSREAICCAKQIPAVMILVLLVI